MKVSKDEVFLFANRLSKNEVVANADVKIYSVKNNLIASGITNDEGVFKFNKKDIGKDVSSANETLFRSLRLVRWQGAKLHRSIAK